MGVAVTTVEKLGDWSSKHSSPKKSSETKSTCDERKNGVYVVSPDFAHKIYL